MRTTNLIAYPILLAVLAGLLVSPVAAESVGVLLEKGIHQEESIGDLDAAIAIYEKIVHDDQARQSYIAKAYYRLGTCYVKKGDQARAIDMFQTVVSQFPKHRTTAANARSALRKLQPAAEPTNGPPVVVSTMPEALANDVSPDLQEITVTFNQPMMDGSWSWTAWTAWTGRDDTFPQRDGDIHYNASRTACTMPVKLQPGKVYQVGINSQYHNDFQSPGRVPARPYLILFATRQADGKPTPIPAAMIEEAKIINAKSVAGRVAGGEVPVKLNPAPWVDREIMRLKLTTKAGMEIGELIYTADHAKMGEKDAWRIQCRQIITAVNHLQFMHVDAELDSFAPIFGQTTNNTGDYQAQYSPGSVHLTTTIGGKKAEHDIELGGVAYDNEQALYLIRRLPLAPGYKTSFDIFPVQIATVSRCEISVLGKEQLRVGMGTFNCYKTSLVVRVGQVKALEHTLWFSADEHQYLVKYDSGTALMELAGVSVRSKGKKVTYENQQYRLSLTMPEGWFFYDSKTPSDYKVQLQLLPPNMKAWGTFIAVETGSSMGMSARDVADGDVGALKGVFDGYTVREDSWQDMSIDSMPAVRFVADYNEDGREKVESRTYILGESMIYWFVFRSEKALYNAAARDYNDIADSLKLNRQAARKDKMAAERLHKQGWQLLQQQKLSEAEDAFRQATQKDPGNANAWNGLGWARMNQGMTLNAKEAFEQCIAINPDAAGALNGLGQIARSEGNLDEAIRHWEKAIAAQPGATAALSGLAQAYMDRKEYAKAVKNYELWLNADPANADVRKKLEKARQLFLEAPDGARGLGVSPHRKLLDERTRIALSGQDRFGAKWFRVEQEYQDASKEQRERILAQWMADAEHADLDTCCAAIGSLGNVAAKEAVPLTLRIVQSPLKGKGNLPRWLAVRALGRMGELSAVPVLIELLDHRNKDTRLYARVALAEITGVYYESDKDKWRDWWMQKGKPLSELELSKPEAAVISFTKAAARGDVELALACVALDSHDYEDIRDVLTGAKENPFTRMFQAVDPNKEITIVSKEEKENWCSIAWRMTFKEAFTVGEGPKAMSFKAGDTFDLDGNVKKVGNRWLINGI